MLNTWCYKEFSHQAGLACAQLKRFSLQRYLCFSANKTPLTMYQT